MKAYLYFGLHSQLLCTVIIELGQAQGNEEVKRALKLSHCAWGTLN